MEITTTRRNFIIAISVVGMCISALLVRKAYKDAERWEFQHALVNELVNSSKYPMSVLDPNALVKLWNPAMENLTGYSEKEMLGCTLEKIMSPENYIAHASKYPEEMKNPKIGEKFDFDCDIVRKDKTLVPVVITWRVVKPKGWPPHSVAHIEDRRNVTKVEADGET